MNNKWALTALVLTYCVQCSVAASTCEGVTTAVCGTAKTAAEAIDCLKENLGLFRSACGEGMVEEIKRSLKFTERLGGAPFIEAWVKSTDSKAAETPAPGSNSAFQMNLTTFNNTGAVCLDGTPSGYYFRPAPPGSANKDSWVFYMEGGGLCLDFFSCHIRAKSRLGSSNYWDKTHVDGSHTISQDPAINPMFHDWNHVFMPYCTGDVHGGTQVHNNWMGLRFTGHLVVNETLRRLSETSGLSSASNVLLSGQSAGGIGVMLHADYFRTAFPKAHVVAAPEAGFYFPSDVALYEEFIVGLRIPFGPPAALFLTLLYDSYLDESCVAAHHKGELHRCWLASTAVNYIDTPLFLAQNRFDSNQMQFLGLWNKAPRHDAYLEYYGKLALADLHKAAAVPRNGVFMPACFKHTNDLCVGSLTTVNNTRFVDALSTWYTGSAKVAVFDTCSGDLPCNPQCAGPCG